MEPVKRTATNPHGEAALNKLNNPETLDKLFYELKEFNKNLDPTEVRDNRIREAVKGYEVDAKDFMKRYYQSPSYKRKVGGREMMQSDIGFEESALGERLMNTPVGYKAYAPGSLARGYSGPRFLDEYNEFDLREPSRYANITMEGMGGYPFETIVHELSHAHGSPAHTSWLEKDYYGNRPDVEHLTKNHAYDREMTKENPSRHLRRDIVTDEEEGRDFLVPKVNHHRGGIYIEDDPTRGNLRDDIAETFGYLETRTRPDGSTRTVTRDNYNEIPAYQINDRNREYDPLSENSLARQAEQFMRYVNSPTEMAARMRAVVARAQAEGDMGEDDFNLSYDTIRDQAIYDRYPGAQQILMALGVMDFWGDRGRHEYYKEDEDKARAAYNRYIKDRL